MDAERLVSVIVPVYNAEKYLKKCVQSIIGQSYGCLEIILVNDGSMDQSKIECQKLMEKDERIHLIDKKNEGAAEAKNVGIECAKGEFIMFVDSDDYIEPDMIEKMLEKILNTDSDICICNFLQETPEGHPQETLAELLHFEESVKTGFEMLELLNEGLWWRLCQPCTKLYRAVLFKEIRFPRQIVEDLAVMHLIYDKCKCVSFLDHAFYHYVQQEESVLHTKKMASVLDLIKIFIERTFYYEEKGYYNLLSGTEELLYQKFQVCNAMMDLKDTVIKERYEGLKELYWKSFQIVKEYRRFSFFEYWKRKLIIDYPKYYQWYLRQKS